MGYAGLCVSLCRQLNSALSAGENSQLLRDSVTTLTKTLKHIEVPGISAWAVLWHRLRFLFTPRLSCVAPINLVGPFPPVALSSLVP